MNVLLLGSGGREHAIAWKLAQSKHLARLFIAPGNAGTADIGTNLGISATDFPAIRRAVLERDIRMVVVGPEDPLVKGIRDYFLADPALSGILVIGPGKRGAMLEGSKDFAKQFMNRYGIPTAAYRTFTKDSFEKAVAFINSLKPPYVLKADGLAAGKGVIICQTVEEAKKELSSLLLDAKFGVSSEKVVIEEFLTGIEMSAFILTDGKTYKILPEAKDYKRIGEGDTGPNTGGMGSVSPVSFANAAFMKKVEEKVIRPTMNGIISEGIDYRGFLFFGLIKVGDEPCVIEYNCRLGDPETESILPRIENDLLELLLATGRQQLADEQVRFTPGSVATVMLVSEGYPGPYEKGKEITGITGISESIVFHAGTIMDPVSGNVLTNGGRVIAVSSFGADLKEALEKSYRSAQKIGFEGVCFRKDIGFDL
jgi:phosphoribosylamine---glycine ligase